MKIQKQLSDSIATNLLMLEKNAFGIQKPDIWVYKNTREARGITKHAIEKVFAPQDKFFIDYIKRK